MNSSPKAPMMKYLYLAISLLWPLLLSRAEEPVLPREAVPLLEGEGTWTSSNPKPESGTIEKVGDIWKLSSPAKLAKPHELAVNRTFTEQIEKDQVCLLVLKARCVESDSPDGKGRVSVAVQNRANYSAAPIWRTITIGREWNTVFFAFAAANECPEGKGVAKFVAGERKQVVEFADLKLYRFPVGFDVYSAPRMKATYEGRDLDAPWRAEAAERIEKLRRGDFTVRVVDAAGKPVSGAKVHVAMKRHLFGFGSAVDVQLLSGLDQKVPSTDQLKYRNTVDELFSRIVPENGLRPNNLVTELDPAKSWEATGRRRSITAVQWTLQWAQDRKMTSRAHYLVWCYLEQWAKDEIKKGGIPRLLATYDRQFATAIPLVADYVSEWDALNHPVPFAEDDALYRVIGPDVYSDFYKKIRPLTSLPLFVNEDTFNPDRAAGFEKHVRHMIELGATPDGAGFQSHFTDYDMPGIEDEWATWNRLGTLVKQLTVTEYDLQTLDDQLHADHLRDLLTLAFSHPQMTGFVIWGFWEPKHWKPTAAMFKADWIERPAVKVWRDLVKTKWWTNAELVTDEKGDAPLRGYYGWYDITVEAGGKSKAFEIKHATNGGRPTLRLE